MHETAEVRNYNGHNIAVNTHDQGDKEIVIFCHGYRGTSVGPNRFFVRAARMLAERGVSSIRFDQYGSGNSAGNFIDSSFIDWVETTQCIATEYLNKGYKVSLFGQSIGASTVIVAADQLLGLASIVAWVPDASVDAFVAPAEDYIEECGQRASTRFWAEAHASGIAEKYSLLEIPMYIVQCTADEYVSEENRQVFIDGSKPQHTNELFEGYSRSNWSYNQATEIIEKSVNFLTHSLKDE